MRYDAVKLSHIPRFIRYPSDFPCMCSNEETILYANDTVLEYVGTTLEGYTDYVNGRL